MNPENARYLLSALAQSQAAVFAILVSLSFVAVQISDPDISSLVVEEMKKDRRLRYIGIGSLVSIVLDIFSIALIDSFRYWQILFFIVVLLGSACLIGGTIWYVTIILEEYLKDSGRKVVKRVIERSFSPPLNKSGISKFWETIERAANNNNIGTIKTVFSLLKEMKETLFLLGKDTEKYLFGPLKNVGRTFRNDKNIRGLDLLTKFATGLYEKGSNKVDFYRRLIGFLRFLGTLYIEINKVDQLSSFNEIISSLEEIAMEEKTRYRNGLALRALSAITGIWDFSSQAQYKEAHDNLIRNPYFGYIIGKLYDYFESFQGNPEERKIYQTAVEKLKTINKNIINSIVKN